MIVGYDHKRKRMTGIGADDKNGIWICLKCLEDFKAVKCAFFVQEEVGCIGSGHADMSFFSDCRFVIQCDRKGNGDMVTQINGMKLCSNDFISAIDFPSGRRKGRIALWCASFFKMGVWRGRKKHDRANKLEFTLINIFQTLYDYQSGLL